MSEEAIEAKGDEQQAESVVVQERDLPDSSEDSIASVQSQVFVLAVIVIAQLWLVTDALYELLSGRREMLGWLTLASGIGFLLALVITLWPRWNRKKVQADVVKREYPSARLQSSETQNTQNRVLQ